MCLAIPGQIVEMLDDGMARVRIGESQTYLTTSTMLLPEAVVEGDYIIVHAGFALHKLRHEDALETLRLYREMAETLEGKPAEF